MSGGTHRLNIFSLRIALAISLLGGNYANSAPIYGYKVIATYPHSTESYTEGFFYLDGIFYESTGINGHSAVMAKVREPGRILLRRDLPFEFLGEEIVNWGSNVYQGIGKAHVFFIND